GALCPARRRRRHHPRYAAGAGAPARGGCARLDRRHREHRARAGARRRGSHRGIADQRRERDDPVVSRSLSGTGARDDQAARRRAHLLGDAAGGDGHADGRAARHVVCDRVRRHPGDDDREHRLRRRRAQFRRHAERAAGADRGGGQGRAVAHRRRDRGGDRRHEPADLRRPDGQAAGGRRARRVLHADPDEEEQAGHAAVGHRAAAAAGGADVHDLPRDDDDWGSPSRDGARMPRPRDAHGDDAIRTGAVQDCAPQRGDSQRRAGIRGLRASREPARASNQGDPGRGHQGLPSLMRFYLTTAIDYVNSRPHLGTAYEKITADVIARYKRLAGFDTHLLMGNDEHSQNVYKRAVERGMDPLAYCDSMEQEFRSVWKQLDIAFDDFIRTTQPRHKTAVQKLAQNAFAKGDIYEGFYEGWYCVSCEAFKQEKDLVDGKCPLHPTLTPEWLREKNYFFRLSKYRDRLLAHFAEHPEFLEPDVRRNEILKLLESGLEDISVSRAGQLWGIPLPFAPETVIYVWFDALTCYAAGVGYGTDEALFKTWWPADLHIVGKDITRFHTVVWPAMLMSAELPLPKQVFGHGWVNFGG